MNNLPENYWRNYQVRSSLLSLKVLKSCAIIINSETVKCAHRMPLLLLTFYYYTHPFWKRKERIWRDPFLNIPSNKAFFSYSVRLKGQKLSNLARNVWGSWQCILAISWSRPQLFFFSFRNKKKVQSDKIFFLWRTGTLHYRFFVIHVVNLDNYCYMASAQYHAVCSSVV